MRYEIFVGEKITDRVQVASSFIHNTIKCNFNKRVIHESLNYKCILQHALTLHFVGDADADAEADSEMKKKKGAKGMKRANTVWYMYMSSRLSSLVVRK